MNTLKYCYYSKKQKTFAFLGFSSIDDFHISHVQFPITISDSSGPHMFTSENALVSYCVEHNRQVEKEYEETFKIEPPYLLSLYTDHDGSITYYVYYKDRGIAFEDMHVIPKLGKDIWDIVEDAPIYEFFRIHRGQLFDSAMMTQFHKFALEREVFFPCRAAFGRARFAVKLGDRISIAEVRRCLSREEPCFLNFDSKAESNKEVFKYYNISREYLSDLFHIDTTKGDWPYSAEQTVYDIINYINSTKYANCSIPQGIIIQGNVVKYQTATFTIEQTKNSKWYLCGDINSILEMFGLDSKDKLRTYMNSILGEKKRSGVFPECETREEIEKLITSITT